MPMFFLSVLEASDVMGPKSVLASIVVVLAALQVLTMSIVYGWLPGSGELRQKLAPYHRWEGRLVFLLVIAVAALCIVTWGPRSGTTRALLHSILGITVVAALVLKVFIVRYAPKLRSTIPVFGFGLFAGLIAIWFLTAYWYWFSDGSAYQGSQAAAVVVKIADAEGVPGRFVAADVTIKAGDVVQWDHESARGHTVSGDGFDSGPNGMNRGDSFKFQFNTPGRFSYICNFHPQMRGTVTVTGTAPARSTPGRGY